MAQIQPFNRKKTPLGIICSNEHSFILSLKCVGFASFCVSLQQHAEVSIVSFYDNDFSVFCYCCWFFFLETISKYAVQWLTSCWRLMVIHILVFRWKKWYTSTRTRRERERKSTREREREATTHFNANCWTFLNILSMRICISSTEFLI